MSPDRQDTGERGAKAAPAVSKRDEKRAAALRANLQRRKAQARGRADLAAEPTSEAPLGGESRSD